MCAVSMITDHFQQKWPLYPSQPSVFTITREQWDEYQALKRKAEAYDKHNNQPDCVKPDLASWEAQIEQVLKKHGVI